TPAHPSDTLLSLHGALPISRRRSHSRAHPRRDGGRGAGGREQVLRRRCADRCRPVAAAGRQRRAASCAARRRAPPVSPAMRFALRLLAICLAVATSMAGAARAALPIEHWTTANGARVFFVRADAIPMLDVSLDFD